MPGGLRSFRWLALVGLIACIDTALGLVVEVGSADVLVAADTLEVNVSCDVRVGTHALAGDDFTLPMASIFVGDLPVAEINLNRPAMFTGRLEPGESRTIEVDGQATLTAFPNARDQLCGASEATVVVQWIAEEQPDDPLDPPLRSAGTANGSATIRCE